MAQAVTFVIWRCDRELAMLSVVGDCGLDEKDGFLLALGKVLQDVITNWQLDDWCRSSRSGCRPSDATRSFG